MVKWRGYWKSSTVIAPFGETNLTLNASAGFVYYLDFSILVPYKYNVTLVESGLPPYTKWSATLNGTTEASTNQTLMFTLSNGTYTFSVKLVQGVIYEYEATPSNGSITVNGSNVIENFTFAHLGPTKYNVVFTEQGLPSGYYWSFTFNGTNYTDPYDSWGFSVPNGTYSYRIDNASGYTVYPYSGKIVVNGNDDDIIITFTAISYGYFAGSVSPSNATISIFINGSWHPYEESNGSFNVSLNPGTYRISISAPGYETFTTNLTVSSSTVTALEIHSLTKVSKHSSFPLLDVVGITAAMAIIAAISAAILLRKRKR